MARHAAILGAVNEMVARGEYERAEGALRRALAVDPRDVGLLHSMGYVLVRMRRFVQAEYFMRRAVELTPQSPAGLHNLASLLVTLGKFEDAAGVMGRVLEVDPRDLGARGGLAKILWRQNRFATARRVLEEGLNFSPEDPELLSALAHTLHQHGRAEEAVGLMRRTAGVEPSQAKYLDLLCSMLTYAPGVEAREVFEAHVEYGKQLEREVGARERPAGAGGVRGTERPLRVGLISGDLRRHAVASFIEPLLGRVDRGGMAVHCYYVGAAEDSESARLKGLAEGWRHMAGQSAQEVAAAIGGDGIDVLIDLAGHTAGNRLAVMAMRPAPVQMTYLGYANTTGVGAIDYRIVDSITDPVGSEGLATEALIRVDPCFLCFRAARVEEASVRGATEPITFASFASAQKLSTRLLGLWSEVLLATPGSRLILKSFAYAEEGVRQDVLGRLEACGVDAARVEVRPAVESLEGHLKAYSGVDISLDTLPYNGTTTIFESLLMGVPVVTMRGKAHAGRVAESILRGVGLVELVAEDERGYVRLAKELAGDRARLAALRRELPGRLRGSALCDEGAFAARFCAAVRGAWEAGRKPEGGTEH